MLKVLRQRNFALLWSGGLISQIGNWLLLTAMPFYVFDLTGSALATSAIFIAFIAPGIVLGSLAGVFADRWDRKRTMLIVSILQTAVLLPLLFVNSASNVWIIYAVLFAESSLAFFFSPAENALLPSLVGEEDLVTANSLNSLNDNLARIGGPALGGLLLGVSGFGSVVLLDALTYFLAAVLIFFVQPPANVSEPANVKDDGETAVSPWRAFWQEWAAGLRVVSNNQSLRRTFTIIGLAMFADAMLSAVLVVFVQTVMGLDAIQFGWLMTARGIGGIIGGLLIGQLGQKLDPKHLMAWGLLISGIIIVAVVNFPSYYFVMPMLVIVGLPVMAWIVSIYTLLQQESTDEFRGRIFGAFSTTNTLVMLLGTSLAGLLADQIGSAILLNISAFLTVGAGLLAFPLLTKSKAPQEAMAAD